GIGVYRPRLLQGWREVIGDAPGAGEVPPRFRLAPLLRAAMARGAVTGQHHHGAWTDVGTPQRLEALDRALAQRGPARIPPGRAAPRRTARPAPPDPGRCEARAPRRRRAAARVRRRLRRPARCAGRARSAAAGRPARPRPAARTGG